MPRNRDDSPDGAYLIHGRYEKIEKLGEGTYGKVYKARDSKTDQVVALKKCRLQLDAEGVPPTTIREVSLLQVLSRSNHVVKLLGVEQIEEDGKVVLYLIFEYLQHDLKKFMDFKKKEKHNPLQPELVKPYLFQLIRGMAFMHQHGVMHRDLKPQNLLVDPKTNVLKIADLGLGRVFALPCKAYTHEIVTLWYRAPEVLLGTKIYSLPVDVWSIGCIFAEMVKGIPFFPADCEIAQLFMIFQVLGTPNEEVWPGVTSLRDWHMYPQWQPMDLHTHLEGLLDHQGCDLLKKMLVYNPNKRIPAKQAMKHPYFDDLDMEVMDALENPEVLNAGMEYQENA
uniref:cyclin-dependent kinase n=1 Tax=Acrosiphonia duriuscula TaxID=138170 RepID=Q94IE7_9CHLO|nr:cyclin-dependent kinase 1 [Acrosiphonia duriuscula]